MLPTLSTFSLPKRAPASTGFAAPRKAPQVCTSKPRRDSRGWAAGGPGARNAQSPVRAHSGERVASASAGTRDAGVDPAAGHERSSDITGGGVGGEEDIRDAVRDSVHPMPSGMPVTELPYTRDGVLVPTDPPAVPTPLSHSSEAAAEAGLRQGAGGGGGASHQPQGASGGGGQRSEDTAHGQASRHAM
ncbi:hypothetical protein GPECTOR_74g702 [Gonium pectorale]|uniref:Uncharacterized protein n=1 Tax=Gonium pectorale TaxID=33097 RepID=A0A150G2M0_GONPE|nr:hypothetical protein GPECTOR_74g702 [Gonium pectorale]|eukprot:KXZ44088.1 hypothetical protein GPECTOR_74g702 [Gonium pectorale]